MRIKTNESISYWALSAAGFILTGQVYAATPLWTFSAPSPATVTVAENTTATVQYTVTNQSKKVKNLILQTTPGLSAPVCHLEGQGSTCILDITVSGSQIAKTGLHGGPVLCEQSNPNQCYRPSAANQLAINYNEDGPVVAVGYYANGSQFVPLSYTSTDFGQSWTQHSPDAQGAGNNYLLSVSCNIMGSCVAVGYYAETLGSGRFFPLSYTSIDFGRTWTVGSLIAADPDNNNLNGVTCNAVGRCMAVGSYSYSRFPLSYTSTNFGRNWTQHSPSALGSNINILRGVTCNADSCVAVGHYFNGSRNIPLSYRSTDFGESWRDVSPAAKGLGANSLTGVACNATGSCVAVGYYSNGGLTNFPLSYTSTDFGENWLEHSPTAIGSAIILLDVTCNAADKCMAVGYYGNGTQTLPLVYTTTDFGKTWSERSPNVAGLGDYYLNSVTCNAAGSCVAVGSHSNGSQSVPLSYRTTDFGESWSESSPSAESSDNSLLYGAS